MEIAVIESETYPCTMIPRGRLSVGLSVGRSVITSSFTFHAPIGALVIVLHSRVWPLIFFGNVLLRHSIDIALIVGQFYKLNLQI